MEGYLQGAGATEVGQDALDTEREGGGMSWFISLSALIILPVSAITSIRKPADAGSWQMQPAEANLPVIQNVVVAGRGRNPREAVPGWHNL